MAHGGRARIVVTVVGVDAAPVEGVAVVLLEGNTALADQDVVGSAVKEGIGAELGFAMFAHGVAVWRRVLAGKTGWRGIRRDGVLLTPAEWLGETSGVGHGDGDGGSFEME